jgi:type II secretory pathway pseudopilin PulG
MPDPARASIVRPRQAGLTFLAVLLFVAILGASLAVTGQLWHTAQLREKERELLFVGGEYRKAIQLYYMNSPGGVGQYPRELADLVKDPRQPAVRRYLRKLYRDPMTGQPQWGLVKNPDGSIAGVYSLSTEAPFKTANFRKGDAEFEGKEKYSDWKFVYRGTLVAAPVPQQKPAAGQGPQQKPAAGQGPQQAPTTPQFTPPSTIFGTPPPQNPQSAPRP